MGRPRTCSAACCCVWGGRAPVLPPVVVHIADGLVCCVQRRCWFRSSPLCCCLRRRSECCCRRRRRRWECCCCHRHINWVCGRWIWSLGALFSRALLYFSVQQKTHQSTVFCTVADRCSVQQSPPQHHLFSRWSLQQYLLFCRGYLL